MGRLRWGSIGCGDVCERKAGPPLYQVDGCTLIGVTRRDTAKGRDFAARHSACRYFETTAELLACRDVDAVYVATPHELHAENTIAAARAGKHVLCEKPMASNAQQCADMIEACRAAGVVLGVAYYRRCYPSMLRARELVQAGAIGALREVRLNDQFPPSHRVDLVHYFAGDVATVVYREEALLPGSHAEQGPVLYAATHSGAVGIMNIGWKEQGRPETVTLVGADGRIEVDDLKGGSLILRRGSLSEREVFDPLPYTHWGLIENFRDHLDGTAALACSGAEGRKSTVVLDYISALPEPEHEMRIAYDAPPPADADAASGLGLLG